MASMGKWAVGSSYIPVLTQTDLYLLNDVEPEIHPILAGTDGGFQLLFNLSTGQTGGYNGGSRDHDLPFNAKDEPATCPRIDTMIIITEISPWCTIVKNPAGVTLNDVCMTLWREYSDNSVTDKELETLPARIQDQVKRFASGQAAAGWSSYYTPAPATPPRVRRADWLRDRQWFEKLSRNPAYARQRLGYAASNIFVLTLGQYA
ncbi:hypothetical protein WOLCODRAFT_136339 [Wolfiporia cocos MD-104 SS10]|uniref:DUF6699 domain-containing protein n=1 Tax=Wolfiporia cocos (strain MD-104) TaxID=742152 RepID=A0A2H3JLG8_WOLCO|nr:hypothetical protein WOLCODRAFT_136339 [Wolfiporia cocos MD-104 SS10]